MKEKSTKKKVQQKAEKQEKVLKVDKKDVKVKEVSAKERKEKMKSSRVTMIVVFSIFIAITIAAFVLSGYIYGEGSVFNAAPTKNVFVNWIYQHIPALIKTIQIVTIGGLISFIVRFSLSKSFARTNRGKTIVKLINSFIKYLIAIIEIMMVLNAWGVDTTTLLASAGILSLIIGLGAQSLISDIIAGVFIVFEGEYQVGDIVIIDGWRGTVDEIGIRTTKIIDWQGNIKIINNSAISSIINQSKELSVTTCVVAVDYRESIPRVELIIKNNLDKIRAAIPEIVDGPYYKGVDSLGESSVNLLFIATVKETDYYVVQRALNREVKMLFDANNVSIPFPQVTLNQPENFEKKTTSAKDHKKASEFAAEQRTISKGMEDTNK